MISDDTQSIPRYTIIAVCAVLLSAIGVIAFLSWRGVDIGPVASFLIGFIPPTIASLVAVRQNERLLTGQQEIRANVNGNLSRLLDIVAQSTPLPPGSTVHITPSDSENNSDG